MDVHRKEANIELLFIGVYDNDFKQNFRAENTENNNKLLKHVCNIKPI